jgi:hypothetical protein
MVNFPSIFILDYASSLVLEHFVKIRVFGRGGELGHDELAVGTLLGEGQVL